MDKYKLIRARRFILNVIFILLTQVVYYQAKASAVELYEYYPIAQGDSWNYLVSDDGFQEKICTIMGEESVDNLNTVKISIGENKIIWLIRDADGIKTYKIFNGDNYQVFTPPKLLLPNNLEIGETKEYSIDSVVYDKNGVKIGKESVKGRIVLKAIEPIEVRAGKFIDCLNVRMVEDWTESADSYGTDDVTFWLARNIGIIKYFSFSVPSQPNEKAEVETQELISATIKGEKIGN